MKPRRKLDRQPTGYQVYEKREDGSLILIKDLLFKSADDAREQVRLLKKLTELNTSQPRRNYDYVPVEMKS